MGITIDQSKKLFTIHTAHSTYQMGIGTYGHLLHYYYGPHAEGDFSLMLRFRDRGFSGNPYEAGNDRTYSLDSLPQEFSTFGNGDFRAPACLVKDANGVYGADLRFVSAEVKPGKYSLPGLPAAFETEQQPYFDRIGFSAYANKSTATGDSAGMAETLEITLSDPAIGLTVKLLYGVFPEIDIITRSAILTSTGAETTEPEIVRAKNIEAEIAEADILGKETARNKTLYIDKADSASLDFLTGDFDFVHFSGRYGTERLYHREAITEGVKSISSIRGESSHQQSPAAILCAKNTTEESGAAYGIALLYSGNFKLSVELDQFGSTRFSAGLNDEMLSYDLTPGEELTLPEAVLSYASGFAALSQHYHDLVNFHIVHGAWTHEDRPVLLNSWEGCYFDFDGEKVIQLAANAKDLGIDLLVMDDGWFGKRDDDTSGLGDWVTNEKKLGMPLSELAKRIHALPMKFGIWIEPEMVSEDSDFYRAHPDYAFVIPGKKPVRSRYQLVLDFSRREVVDAVLTKIVETLKPAKPDYIKMDMNRSIHEVYSQIAGYQNRGKLLHQYVLGVYDFITRLKEAFPEVLIEGCSGGGGRFDLGMMYYTPQIWLSDNTDAIERLSLQYGASFFAPVSTMGSHVSAVPNHQTGRSTPLATRAIVAMAGSFGYELDPAKLSDEEKDAIRTQIKIFKNYQLLIQGGRYYRLTGPSLGITHTEGYSATGYTAPEAAMAWEIVSADAKRALVSIVTKDQHCNPPVCYIKLKGLFMNQMYRISIVLKSTDFLDRREEEALTAPAYTGAILMQGGIAVPYFAGEYQSILLSVYQA